MLGQPEFFTILSLNSGRNVRLQLMLIMNSGPLLIPSYFSGSTLPSLLIFLPLSWRKAPQLWPLGIVSLPVFMTTRILVLLLSSMISLPLAWMDFQMFLYTINNSNKSLISWRMLVLLSAFIVWPRFSTEQRQKEIVYGLSSQQN